jgi:hypothetical protein
LKHTKTEDYSKLSGQKFWKEQFTHLSFYKYIFQITLPRLYR